MNLLSETISDLSYRKKTQGDVLWVEAGKEWMSWAEFVEKANFEYDDGYGGNEVRLDLKVIGKDFWLERHEYDGSEWWEFKTMPTKPAIHNALINLNER